MHRPKFSDLFPQEQETFGNGVGPSWFPKWLRDKITTTASWFFDEASWKHHDFGYIIGFKEYHRWLYDYKFFRAMLRDIKKQAYIIMPLALIIALIFYLSVMIFGWFNSFRYGNSYLTIIEIKNRIG